MNVNKLRWGLVGASDIAKTRMIPAMRAVGHEIVGVVSSDNNRARDYAERNHILWSGTNLSELLLAGVDAVYISSVNEKHYEQTLAALEAGKHVLCEKPLALSLAEAKEMVAVAEKRGLVLAVNHHLPGSPLHAAVRELIAIGKIGELLSARIVHAVMLPERLRSWRIAATTPGSGVTMDITCHDASVLNPMLGDPVRVTAVEVQQGQWASQASDAVMTVIEYAGVNGRPILAQTHDAFTVEYGKTSLAVQGTAGSIDVIDAMTQDTHGEVWLTDAEGRTKISVDTSPDLYEIVLDAFAAAISGERQPTASGRDGLLAMQVALAAQESATSGQSVLIEEMD